LKTPEIIAKIIVQDKLEIQEAEASIAELKKSPKECLH